MADGTQEWTQFTLPTAPLTGPDTITEPTEEYGPPDVTFIRNNFCPGQRGDEFAIVLVGAEELGQSRARQLIICSEPVTDETGQVALPERRGCRKGEQKREVRRQPHD